MFLRVSGTLSIVGIAHDPLSLKLHVVPGCRFVQHVVLNLDVIQDSNRRLLHFLCVILHQIGNHRRFVLRISYLFHQTGNEKYYCFLFVQVYKVLEVGLICATGIFEQDVTCKSDNIVQCACRQTVVQNNRGTATLMMNFLIYVLSTVVD